ncbi:Defensin-like (DEFL) family protein [Arabidopsis thaliana]|uniref:Defensin-like (DEFL) family protein n=1 Tax=Arabidopsis thaliana TaxID=3702 RepID=F4HQW0_ARATH|nr:Defensin-like (DEFL) family protein [Arabidopsis thaliana]AEE29045.1 Defensin-like (DEFL) family protein [Arabidopsis thaliana]|eukprot:NP_001184986.1 Defensin-like (DEFL) family protein [Arabidopsis thaliana]
MNNLRVIIVLIELFSFFFSQFQSLQRKWGRVRSQSHLDAKRKQNA